MRRYLLSCTVAFALLGTVSAASALSTIFNLNPFTGSPATVQVTVDDAINAGFLTFNVAVTSPMGDLRGVFFDLNYAGALGGGDFSGSDLTDVGFNTANLGGGNNINPHSAMDVGLEFGTPGIGSDDIGSTTFKMSDKGVLTVASIQSVAARVTSVGELGSRDGSSKLISTSGTPVPGIPEPGTMLLVGTGLIAVGMRRFRRRG